MYGIGGLLGGFAIMGFETYLQYGLHPTATDFQSLYWVGWVSGLIDIATGFMIAIGGVWMNSADSRRRRLGGIIAIESTFSS